jgi:N-acyl-D-amino-acid deacylase
VPSQNAAAPVTAAEAVDELIQIAERTGTVGVFTHFKLRGLEYRGTGKSWVEHIQAARARGVRLYMDVYPYQTASSDAGFCLIPSWVLGKGQQSYSDGVARISREPEKLKALLRDITAEIDMHGGPENIFVLPRSHTRFAGQSLAQIMLLLHQDAALAALAAQRLGDAYTCGGGLMRAASIDEQDVRTFYGVDWSATSSDGTGVPDTLPTAQIAQSNPRNFGTYPRRLSRFAGALHSDSLEHAVRSCTGLPAQILGLRDRGLLRAGYRADLAIIDVSAIGDDQSTPVPPRYPTGIEYVLVNGRAAVDASRVQFVLAGRVLEPFEWERRNGSVRDLDH